MDGSGGLSGWRWLFIFDGIITFPMALWGKCMATYTATLDCHHQVFSDSKSTSGYYALPDLPSDTRVKWLKSEEKALALDRMRRAGKQLEEPVTVRGLKRVLGKWHFWVYTAYYT